MSLRALAHVVWWPLALMLAAVVPLSASNFSVNPIQIALSGGRPTAVLQLKNNDPQALRFEIQAFEWKQGPDGGIQLTPTRDIVVFPALLALVPKEERKIRVAYTGAAMAHERTYRILVQELPPAVRAGAEPTGLRMLTHFSIPVFVQALKPAVTGGLYDLTLQDGRASFRLQNIGNTHFMTKDVKVVGRGRRGEVLFEHALKGWYMLAGSTRLYSVAISAAECAELQTLTATVKFGDATMTEARAVAPGACGVSSGR